MAPAAHGTPRILVVDDDPPVRGLLTHLLQASGYSSVAAADAPEARRWLESEQFDLVLCDTHISGESGLELLAQMAPRLTNTATVLVAGIDDPEIARRVLDMGVYGYVVKPFTHSEILISISNALRRRDLESRERRQKGGIAPLTPAPDTGEPAGPELTTRELEVLALLAEGLSNDAIAERLELSLHTVRNHVQKTISKLGAHSKLEAVSIALRTGLIKPPSVSA
ncbi:MAG: response regulator transcription factor [Actinomycetota bacterium]